ncbi:MAG: FAD-binding protein [Gemmatimonadota bacterium]|nr:FAD-binding protein [Gemmatimonadota bacterium]
MIAATPAVQQIREQLSQAASARTPLRIRGRGHWLDAGRPVHATEMLDVGDLSGIVEYVPGDLTLTALAGTPLDEIARVTSAERQWLPLDPPGPADGTLGATISTASAGPLSHSFGTPRDNVLGLQVITGTGELIESGGRVVKNVAGFDLTRLFTGAWGSLGVITMATVRLRGLPEVDESVTIAIDSHSDTLGAMLASLRALQITPLALELLDASLSRLLGAGDAGSLLVRLAGNGEAVRAQRTTLEQVGEARAAPPSAWPRLRAIEREVSACAVLRLSRRATDLGQCIGALRDDRDAPRQTLLHAAVARGVARCIVPATSEGTLDALFHRVEKVTCSRIAERLPPSHWHRMASAAGDPLSRRTKQSFDPLNILNPGILGESA